MEPKRIILVYKGKRLNGKKFAHTYLLPDGQSYLFTKEVYPCAIGMQIEAEETPKGVKAPYVTKGLIKDERQIAEWSVQQAVAIQERRAQDAAKEKSSKDIDELIKLVKETTYNSTDRKRVAFYILHKLLG